MSNQRILVLTTDGGEREDGNVYYASYLLATATGSLAFHEPEFNTRLESFNESEATIIDRIRGYGYEVTQPGAAIIISGDEDEDEDDDD